MKATQPFLILETQNGTLSSIIFFSSSRRARLKWWNLLYHLRMASGFTERKNDKKIEAVRMSADGLTDRNFRVSDNLSIHSLDGVDLYLTDSDEEKLLVPKEDREQRRLNAAIFRSTSAIISNPIVSVTNE